MTGRFEIVARSTRGGATEAWHFGAAVAVEPGGRPVAALGDPAVEVPLRSVAKPVQAVPLLVAGGEKAFDLDDADLALIGSSHAGTPRHVERVDSLLARGGFAVDDLRCGIHPPLDAEAAEALRKAGKKPRAVHNNCSGKHAGLLLACRQLDLPTDGYLDPGHPLQESIFTEIVRFSGRPRGELCAVVDGCGLPTCVLSLLEVARIFVCFADPPAAGLEAKRAAAAARMSVAYAAAPEMIAGPGRFTTRLVAATGGRVLGKEGADGLYAVAVRGPVALGVAVKIADGTEVCRPGVVIDLLRQLGVLSAQEFATLEDLYRPVRRNHSGQEVGAVEPDVHLREA